MTVKISVSGTEGLLSELERFSDAEGAIAGAIERGAAAVGERARELCPVRTGRLRASIYQEASGAHAEIGTACCYAPFVEFGTYKMAARPFLTPALDAALDAIAAALDAAFGG